MTNHQTNEPMQPFRVQSDLLKPNQTVGSEQPPQKSGWRWADEAKWLAIPAFAVIYVAAQQRLEFRPATMIVLLACVLFRMEKRHRQLASVVLTMAAIRLAYQMASHSCSPSGVAGPPQFPDTFVAMPWLPMFFAACVFYLPRFASVTGKIITIGAIAMLVSGLLPGDGYVVIFGMIQYSLFLAVGIGLAVDYSTRTHGNGNRAAVRAA